jgi:putative membrane protein
LRNILLRWLINAVALYLAVQLVPRIEATESWQTFAIVALIFGLVNALIRPILQFFTCPLIILTLGLFTLVINALMLLLTGWLAARFGVGFTVEGFGPAFLGALVVSIVSLALTMVVKDEGEE